MKNNQKSNFCGSKNFQSRNLENNNFSSKGYGNEKEEV